MAYELRGRLSLQIVFGEVEFPFERVNSLDFLHMSASTLIAVPMLHMAVLDQMGHLSGSNSLGDGTLITIRLQGRSTDTSSSKTFKFRLNSSSRKPTAAGTRYEIDAYLDCSPYWHSSTQNSFVGSSSAALRELARVSGFTFKGDNTSDSQRWFPRNMLNHMWASKIAERGYRGEFSCMKLALNLDRTLCYRDLSNTVAPTLAFSLAEPRNGFTLATDFAPVMASGTPNHTSSYYDATQEQTPMQPTNRFYDSLQVRKQKAERSLMVNSTIHGSVNSGRTRISPIDPGNVHSEYEKAYYQNARLGNLFSSKMDVVTPEVTKLNVLDTASLYIDESANFLQPFSGDYWVEGKAIYIQANDYFEKFRLARRSLNSTLPNAM